MHQRNQLRHVVAVRLRDMDRKGNPLSFSEDVVFCNHSPSRFGGAGIAQCSLPAPQILDH